MTNSPGCAIIQSEREKKGDKKMTTTEIKEKIERLERWMYWEEYADFINWTAYHQAEAEINQLKAELKKMEG